MLDSRIETFLCLCETRSYTKTACILNITQPTVTQHIQYLENKYKSSLVTYSGKVLKITEKGNELKKMALAMKANNLKIEHFMLSEYDKDKDINFGSTLTIGEYVMPVEIAEYLSKHPKVVKVNHPSLPENGYKELYDKYFPNGGGSIFTFEIKGDDETAKNFIDHLEIFSLLANVADVKSLVIHPASTTHSQLSEEELLDQGIKPNTIRLSIGTENIDDIIADLDQAFAG
jgi:hypothetical protein